MNYRGVVDFRDIDPDAFFDVVPRAAVEYMRQKGLRVSFNWAEVYGEEHRRAFTVAKMMDADMLADVHQAVTRAIERGQTLAQFRAGLEPMLQKAGWWGIQETEDPLTGERIEVKLGSPRRLETIFRTNMQSAYAAGQWQQIEDQALDAPYLLYEAVDDYRTRPDHAAWDNTVLPVTDPWWQTHYPLNGWNCRCTVLQLDDADLETFGLKVSSKAPAKRFREWTNPRTNKVERVPFGIDPGFEWNPGATKKRMRELNKIFAEKVINYPPEFKKAIAAWLRSQPAPSSQAKAAAAALFDESTTAGKWHAASFKDAPPWLVSAVQRFQAVEVETSSGAGAWAYRGSLIKMGDKYKPTGANGQGTWRHEFGHIMDVRLARTNGGYWSYEADFPPAMHSDAVSVLAAAGKGRRRKKLDALLAARAKAYSDVEEQVRSSTTETREAVLRDIAKKNGVDFERFIGLICGSTVILDETELGAMQIGQANRIAKMMAALSRGDAEEFVRLGYFLDVTDRDSVMAMIRERRRQTEKDPVIALLSGLIGALTRNQAASYHDGFPGHSNKYYRSSPIKPGTEVFANLTALAGHPNRYWWELAKQLFPNITARYESAIKEAGGNG